MDNLLRPTTKSMMARVAAAFRRASDETGAFQESIFPPFSLDVPMPPVAAPRPLPVTADEVRQIVREEIEAIAAAERELPRLSDVMRAELSDYLRRTKNNPAPVQVFGRDHLPS